jgi:hypothetical protein
MVSYCYFHVNASSCGGRVTTQQRIAAFSRHRAEYCTAQRGPVLERTGVPRRYRFRFRNPLLQPFVIMEGLAQGLIKRADLEKLDR